MAITLRVEWTNKDDELLGRDALPHVHLSAGGIEVAPRPGSSSRSFPEYEVPDSAQSVRVELAVIGTIQLKYAARPRPWRQYRGDISKSKIPMQPDLPVLLWACQEFNVPRSGNAPLEPVGPIHPLMECLAAGSAAGSAVIVRVCTDFLDVTEYYFDFAAQDDQNMQDKWESSHEGDRPKRLVDIYHAAHERENQQDPANPMRMTVLGYTGGRPKIWFAHYCEPRLKGLASADAGVLVYYRPNTEPYSRVCEINQGMMDRNSRYFLAPNDQEFREGNIEAADRIYGRITEKGTFRTTFVYVRIGMEQAIRRSGKPIVLIVPYPHAHDYGRSAASEMPLITEVLLRFLHGNGEIATSQPSVKLGRLGIGGFSAGGYPMGAAFRQCSKRISELYIFDATAAWGYADQVIQWAWSTPGARLRISMGFNEKPMNAIFLKSLEFINKKGAEGLAVNGAENVTAWPHFNTGEEFEEAFERNDWWRYYVSEVAVYKKVEVRHPSSVAVRHQFAMFAGEQRPVTFLELFLSQSGY